MLVTPSVGIAFKLRLPLRRRETVTFGSYGLTGLSLARAREKLVEAKRMIAEGCLQPWKSSAPKDGYGEARDFAHVAQKWMDDAPMAQQWSNAVDAWETGRIFSPVVSVTEPGPLRFSPAS